MRNLSKRLKALATLALTILLLCSFTLTFLFYGQNTLAYADDAETNAEETDVNLSIDTERLIASTREEYKDLQEYEYSPEIKEEIEQTGKTVGESLVDQICYYQQMLGTATDQAEIDKINALIDGTKNILDTYQAAAKQQSQAVVDTQQIDMLADDGGIIEDFLYKEVYDRAAPVVAAAIAWFNGSNYLLSGELLTHAWIDNYTPGNYLPIHGNRVVGSPLTYDFVNSDETFKKIKYETYHPNAFNDTTCYEEDLGFSLHGADIERSSSSSTRIKVSDDYDFHAKNVNNVLNALNNIYYEIQSFGLIKTYKVVINVNVADALYLKLNSTTNGVHSVSVYNYSDKPINVAYNTKMCAPADAKIFQNLSDIDSVKIPAKGSKTVQIAGNGTASHITFCYIKDGHRIVTYADELYLDRSILNFTFEKKLVPAADIAIITKKGSQWLVQFTNYYDPSYRLEYNSKMCYEDDAKNWTGLKDINICYLEYGDSKFVYISENYFATHIAARFVNKYYEYYVYANELNANGNMSVGRRISYVYNYLQIENKGKVNGKWKIKVSNPLDKSIAVYYNSKMCNYDDAKNWTGLNDIPSPVTISANSYEYVYISPNWFATSIAISYIDNVGYIENGYRLISYADGLNTNGSMNVYNNRIEVEI